MDMGAGLAIAGTAFAIAAIIIKWIGHNTRPQCNLHALIEGQIKDLREGLHRIEDKLDEVIKRV
jgi:hypothetical protein